MLWFFDSAVSFRLLARIAVVRIRMAFPISPRGLAHPTSVSELHSPACVCPSQRFNCVLTASRRMTRGTMVRYTFPVWLLHPILHADFHRGFP